VPWVRGAALAIRREAFEAVGGFDESFFIYGEEMDLCYRLREANWSVHFAPVTTVIHVGGASTDQRRTDMQVQLFASLRHFYRLHYSRRRLALLIVIVTGFAVAKWCLDRLRLAAVRDGHERARIEEDLAAWKRVALGRWRRQVSGA